MVDGFKDVIQCFVQKDMLEDSELSSYMMELRS